MGIKDWNSRKSQSFTFGRSMSMSMSMSRSSSSRRRPEKKHQQQQCIKLGHDDHDDHDQGKNQGSRWKVLWWRIKREKHRMFVAAYDPEAYSRNFDDGVECREPEYLTRSFSARFADPTIILNFR